MISKQLVDLTHVEAARLRKNATADELDHLDFESFNPGSDTDCIYGQMIGYCRRPRAVELIRKCATRIVKVVNPDVGNGNGLDNVSCELAFGAKETFERRTKDKPFWGEVNYFSPIETYIAQDGADNKQLIAYLRGEIETLDLTPTINC